MCWCYWHASGIVLLEEVVLVGHIDHYPALLNLSSLPMTVPLTEIPTYEIAGRELVVLSILVLYLG